MKKRMTKLLLSIFLLFYVLYINVDIILALINTEQIIKTGGTNIVNTDGEMNGVEVSKVISASDIENYFDITLKVKTTERVNTPDLAIVFVMDISYTMVEGMDGNISRYTASVNAAKNLINKFSEFSKDATSERLMGYVAFNTDAHKIFDLSECKSECKDLETNKKLSDLMSEKTSAIINESGYASSHSRFTNIEAGLKMAEDMLATTSIKNKYIILLSDGFPTTYIDKGYNGYDPYMTGKSNITSSIDGKFYNEVYGLPCLYGTSYSDRGAIKARQKAIQIENTGVKIFSVGVGINDENLTKVDDYMKADSGRVNKTDSDDRFAVVDTETTDYEIGKSIQDYKNWLEDDIGSGYYYDASNSSELEDAYNKIFEEVKKLSEVWVTEDPMGLDGNVANIDFLGLYDETYTGEEANGNLTYELKKSLGQVNTASFNEKDNKISWDLKESDYTEEDSAYIYELKYRVRLKNELESFVPEKEYDTNAKTTLSYVIKEGNVLSEKKMIDFPIPSVEGYLGKLEFNKKSDFDFVNLSGAEFLLSHDENCECHKEKKYATITDITATSNEDGVVTFNNIPSGHTYKLKETKALKDHYLLDENEIYDITVSFGTTTGTPVTNGIVNKIIRGNLEIKKVVEGNIEDSGKFKFKLEAWYNGNKLKGEYEYTLNSKVNGKLNIENNIELGHNDTIVIKGLPIGSTYKITELTTEGYDVQYQLNSNKVSNGNVVTCDGNCKITQENNKVKFINITGYVLPDTGSNLGLIMYIMSTFILIVSIIYIGYYFYANKS